LPFADSIFDCVLLDAPCSGTGTIRHNPEIRWHLTPEELEDLPAKQLKILRNAAKTVKRKGRLIYSTCSLEPEESEDVIAEFLRRNSNFENATAEFQKEFLTDKNFVRTFPHRHNVDGFFVAVLRRFR
jgi:16S rRNA (cytosine967-C5)-methyltransferase